MGRLPPYTFMSLALPFPVPAHTVHRVSLRTWRPEREVSNVWSFTATRASRRAA
jgi:hypothetical protein